jgi:hypothetical protein
MFPMFLVPTFAVPMSGLFHVLALAGLRRAAPIGPVSAHVSADTIKAHNAKPVTGGGLP